MRRQRAYRAFDFFARIDPPDWRVLRELTRIGAPIAGSMLAEGGLFVCAALMMGGMGATLTAGHQIALNYASFMFMVPLAISSATTIHVGHTLGRGDRERGALRRAARHRHVRERDGDLGHRHRAVQRQIARSTRAIRRCASSRRGCC